MFCWHTCASIYKQKKDFAEAAKCFQNALRLESDNLQIMREAASLQVQVRDLSNHTLSRFNILKQKPGMIQNWIAFAISHHLVLYSLFSEEIILLFLKLFIQWIISSKQLN